MKKDLLIFTSEAGAGKDYLLNKCVEKFGWHKVVSHTTRPIRQGEIDGKDYHFTSDALFLEYEENGDFIETTSYVTTDGTWHYGFHKDSIEVDGIKCLILNPHGVSQFLENGYADRMIIIQVCVPTETRILRYMNRLGENPTEKQLAEGFLRLVRDIEDFREFEDSTNASSPDNVNLFDYMGVPVEYVYNDLECEVEKTLEYISLFVRDINE